MEMDISTKKLGLSYNDASEIFVIFCDTFNHLWDEFGAIWKVLMVTCDHCPIIGQKFKSKYDTNEPTRLRTDGQTQHYRVKYFSKLN